MIGGLRTEFDWRNCQSGSSREIRSSLFAAQCFIGPDGAASWSPIWRYLQQVKVLRGFYHSTYETGIVTWSQSTRHTSRLRPLTWLPTAVTSGYNIYFHMSTSHMSTNFHEEYAKCDMGRVFIHFAQWVMIVYFLYYIAYKYVWTLKASGSLGLNRG